MTTRERAAELVELLKARGLAPAGGLERALVLVEIDIALAAAVAEECERCAQVAHGLYLEEGPPVAPLGSHLAVKRVAGASIAQAIRESGTSAGGGT